VSSQERWFPSPHQCSNNVLSSYSCENVLKLLPRFSFLEQCILTMMSVFTVLTCVPEMNPVHERGLIPRKAATDKHLFALEQWLPSFFNRRHKMPCIIIAGTPPSVKIWRR
jgi:hypothetical protein